LAQAAAPELGEAGALAAARELADAGVLLGFGRAAQVLFVIAN
jgi:hypothetical protein